MVVRKMPVAVNNPYFDVKHSQTIRDKFFFYSNKIHMGLPAAIVDRDGTALVVKVLDKQTGEHTNFPTKVGSIPQLVELLARHFNLVK